ncbi:MAG: chemotaxis protein CheB [Janthinobacterium lividum]
MSDRSAIIVIGASAGGVEAIGRLVAALPRDFDAALFVVLHIGAHKSELPSLLNRWGTLRASHPGNGEQIRRGHIYVAPPDHHMVLEEGVIRLTRGPRENWARPAVDPLFRSAARAYGSDTIGVILTGGLNDGTAGLFEIKQRGGTTIVQDPDDAADPGMPRSALQHVAVDHCLPLGEIPPMLTTLVAGRRPGVAVAGTAFEVVKAGSEEMTADYTLNEPVAVTCPDCGGALRRTELGTLIQFRCHIGHVYTAEVMVAAQFEAMEWALEASMRALSERGELCRQMADRSREAEDAGSAAQWASAMREAKERTGTLRQLLEKEWTHPAGIGSLVPSGG